MKWQKSKKTIKEHAPVFLFLTALTVLAVTLVSAKYTRETRNENTAVAKEFYFTSDLLDGKEHDVVPTEGSASGKTASVTIRLKNHVDELRYSEVAIDYTVAVTEQNSASAAGVTIDRQTGTIAAGKATGGNTNDVDVKIANLEAGKTYTVTATTSNAYNKTLTGTIKVAPLDTNIYASISDKTQYIEVTVWTTDYAGVVSLKYDNIGLLPDNTDVKMQNAKSAGGTLTDNNWGANTSHVFRFFKSDTTKSYKAEVNAQEVIVSEK